MGKQGPCFHCGVASTPLWRNGPPDKPVLCNACGSRWRIKGTLVNYTPLHARPEADEYEDQRVSKVKTIFPKIGDAKLKKRKLTYENFVGKSFVSEYKPGFLKSTDEATSNKSSSGSAVSYSESFGQFSGADASDFTGADQSAAWDTQVPSKKRTCVTRTKPSPVEKLIKDLHAILHEQQSSYQSGSSEEDLLFESDTPMVSVEIGHGSVLIKHPSSFVQEDDSDANSLSFGNKPCNINEPANYGSASLSGSNCFKRSSDHTQEVESGTKFSLSKDLQNAKKPLQEQNLNIPGKETTEGLKRGLNKSGIGSLFNLQNIKLDSCNDEDLLLDVPSNGSFPEAELLLPSTSITSSSSSIYQAMVLH